MKKHLFLPIFLGLVFNTLFFAQSSDQADMKDDVEVTIERTIIEEDGNQSKVTIVRKGSAYENDAPAIMKVSCHKSKPVSRVRMGVELSNATEGVNIDRVVPGSAAARAGLQDGDIITAIDKTPMNSYDDLLAFLLEKDVDEKIKVSYVRDEKKGNTNLILEKNLRHPDFKHLSCRYINKPCLGVNYHSYNGGVRISRVLENSGAEVAGIQSRDRIVSIDGQTSDFGSQFDRIIKSQKPGTTVMLAIDREGENISTTAEIGVWDACGVCRLLSQEEEIIEEIVEEAPQRETINPQLELASFDMYPVPASDQLTVSFLGEEGPIEVTLLDAAGKVISQEKISNFSGSFTKTYKLQDAAKGLAVLSISQNGKTTTRQALIQ